MKAKWKDSLRSVRKSRSRFLSIFCIVAIGVGFFAGVKAGGTDMWKSADAYADQQNLMHYRLLSTWGFEDEDIDRLRQEEGITVWPSYFLDGLALTENGDKVSRMYAWDPKSPMNELWLEEGRMPESADECLLDATSAIALGDQIEISSGSDTDIHESLENTSYTVVGKFRSAMYLSDMEKGNTSVGSGKIDLILYLPAENFKSEYYTEVYAVFEDMKDALAYSDEYKSLEEQHLNSLEQIGKIQAENRYNRVVQEAQDKIDDGQKELDDGRRELKDAKKQLEDAKKQVQDGETQIADGEREITDGEAEIEDGEAEIEANEAKVEDGEAQLAQQEQRLEEARRELSEAQKAYEEGKQQLENARLEAQTQLEEAWSTLENVAARLEAAQKELESGQQEYEAAKKQFDEQMASAEAQINEQRQMLNENRALYEAGEAGYTQNYSQYEAGEADYAQGYRQYEAAEEEYTKNYALYEAGEEKYIKNYTLYEAGEKEYSENYSQYQQKEEDYSVQEEQYQQAENLYNQNLAQYNQIIQALSLRAQELEALKNQVGENDPAYLAAKQAYDNDVSNAEAQRLELEAEALRIQQIKANLQPVREELNGIKAALEESRQELDGTRAALTEVRGTLDQTKIDLETGRKTLDETKTGLEKTREELDGFHRELQEVRQTLDETHDQLEQGETALAGAQQKLHEEKQAGEKKLAEVYAKLQEGRQDYEEGRAEYEEGVSEYEKQEQNAQQELAAAQSRLDSVWNQIVTGQDQLRSGEEQIAQARQELISARAQIEEARQQIQEAREKLAQARQELADARLDLEEGRQKILDNEKKVADGEKDLEEAGEKLEDARKELADLEEPVWYVNTRDDNAGYEEYGQNAERVDNIAKIFPVFFILVAALVCLTTMTRMIEEERTQIGTMKALGYRNSDILSKYLFYALTATFIGALIGLVVGYQLFPTVIMVAYGMLYHTVIRVTPFLWGEAAWIMAACLGAVGLTVYLCCRSVLRPMPAQLMRPKAPKNGKRVLLERVGWLWKRLSFSRKVSVRNIFRYKKRMIMTIVGITGCTALSLTGFGLKDSINGIVVNQFEKIWHYEATIVTEDLTQEDLKETLDIMRQYDAEANQMQVMQKTYTMKSSDGRMSANLMVPESGEQLSSFIRLENRTSHTVYQPEEDGVILTEKLANKLGVSDGDSIQIEIDDTHIVTTRVIGVVENYAYHYAYMLSDTYEKLLGQAPEFNMLLGQYQGLDVGTEHEMAARINENDHVLTIQLQSDIMENFNKMLKALDMVVVVLILSAGALAFVVLYNLANVNITERVREIATLEVLGFNDKEVSQYIFRESIVLTLMGTLLGLGAGRLLTTFVVQTAEIDMVMFGREVQAASYLWAALLTLIFNGIVNLVMHRPLRKISMVESLKSVE